MVKLYYRTPSQKIFNDVKDNAIKIWKSYDDTYGYATEKLSRIEPLENIKDNMMTIVAMFDTSNQIKLRKLITKESREAIRERLKDGGMSDNINVF